MHVCLLLSVVRPTIQYEGNCRRVIRLSRIGYVGWSKAYSWLLLAKTCYEAVRGIWVWKSYCT